jgi:adhesin transport system membrane fusion protein
MQRAGFGGDESAGTANVYRDRDWSERRRTVPTGAPAKAPPQAGYTWQKPDGQKPDGRKPGEAGRQPQADRRRAPPIATAPAATSPAPAAQPDRRLSYAGTGASTPRQGGGAAAAMRASPGEWSLPKTGGDSAGPIAALAGALPRPLAALTDRLNKVVERNEDFSQRFVDAIERIAHGAGKTARAAAPPPMRAPAPAAAGGGGWRASMDRAMAGRDAGDRSFFGGGGGGGEWSDAELIQDAKEASRRETSHLARTLLRFVLLFIAVFVVWAALFKIDEVTRGDGKVAASSQTQVLGNLEGGVVREILAREGDRVAKGDVLMRLDNAQAVANFRENRAKYLTLTAQIARLNAELRGTPLSFPAEVTAEAPEVARAESALMDVRLSQFEAQIQILRQQRTQRAQDLADLRNKADKSGQQLRLVREQLRILEPLAAEGLAPRVEVIRNQRDLSQTEGELESARLQIPKAEAALREADQKIDERIDGFKSDTQKELNDRALQLEAAREASIADRDRVTRTELRAPVNGVVKQIYIKTVGGAVKPGQDLIEVVPTEETLLVEIKVKPADVGFVHVGQKANVKVTAYDYSLYGSLDAKVEDISADTFVEERAVASAEPFFRVRLRTAKKFLAPADRPLPISPGMVVSADIQTGERTVLTYLTKPFFKTLTSSLGER